MTFTPRHRYAIAVVGTFSVMALVLQAAILRPRLWPAGAGFTLSGDQIMVSLADPTDVPLIRPPDVNRAVGAPITIATVRPGSPADRAGLRAGQVVVSVADSTGARVEPGAAGPATTGDATRVWRQAYWLRPTGPLTLEVLDDPAGRPRQVVVDRPPVWSSDGDTFYAWLHEHGGPLTEHAAYAFAALLVVALGARGTSAALMILAFLLMGHADTGLLMGAGLSLPVTGPLLLVFNWLVTALAVPLIGLAVLHFPRRAPLLDRYPWILPLQWIVAAPLATIGLLAAFFLLGIDGAESGLSVVAERPWLFLVCFGLGLAMNVAVVFEGVKRYKTNPDAAERRRIQTVVFTAVPGTLSYVILTGLPVLAETFGTSIPLPWPVELLLQLLVLGTAVGLAYAVAVRRAFGPRTVLRRSMQYAFARKTLAVAGLLPAVALAIVLIRQRDRSLGAIISGAPGFYLICVGLIALSLRYREAAQRWLDRRFFRTEYDAREVLLALAAKVPYESDPRSLVNLVLGEIGKALHPETAAVLAEGSSGFEMVVSEGPGPATLDNGSAIVQLLRWSDEPLEILQSDERSPVARLPAADREWLRTAGLSLLVPIVSGTGSPRALAGFLALGPKRSEEPYTGEDRGLLSGIAAQMGVALDLSRLRRIVADTPKTPRRGLTSPPTVQAVLSGGAGVQIGQVIDGKYRIDALIGRGGMGAVYRARDLGLERDVALKIVRAELVSAPESRERFRREAQMAARLNHPAIVTVFDFGTLDDGTAYLVMEYVRGEDLRSRLTRLGAYSPPVYAELLTGLAAGIEAAHREGILHRDLKPENVLLPEDGSVVKVLDFGVAKATAGLAGGPTAPTLTSAGTIVGTPAYMAPEQLRGEGVDGRADVYSLGVMSYEALTGRLPYGGGSFVDVAMRQADDRKVVDTSTLPPAIASVLLQAIAVSRDRRPATPSALAEAMTAALRQ